MLFAMCLQVLSSYRTHLERSVSDYVPRGRVSGNNVLFTARGIGCGDPHTGGAVPHHLS